ncbi:DivIVA domain-containing protein [Reichenbachiella carrageenanivorans]|uniref:DivIVA domain-containing protein n=1 Tax=Reichenbachiella carrageenanivorans TaxID=2979869 RepID=A0ABY6CXR4_9BACT|nr:DivIVA domain-containing protein [Reichenbachiella carrageenanivorans]UXX77638.1 DivIVA domain-containing protein [Reichenbachiella carrageenanivorans]
MKITPLEIRQKTFEKAFRGLDKDEVTAFLLSLSHEWERFLDENKELKQQREKLEKEVQKLREVETTLFKTLKTAEDTGANVIDQANRTAALHMKETQINADAMISDAKNKARTIIEKAEMEAREVMEEMTNEVKELEESYRIIENQRENIISQLKILSGDVMSKVDNIKLQESGIETHVKKVKQLLRETSERVSNHSDESVSKIDSIKLDEVKAPVIKTERVEEPKQEDPDRTIVKKNYISEENPIARNIPAVPAPKTKKETVADGGLSFFDELED